MAKIPKYTVEQLAKDLHDILKSDRDVVVGIAGMTGEGKSVAAIQLLTAYSNFVGVPFSMEHITWLREELLEWIDGPEPGHKAKYGGQKSEYSALLPDELISMFYKRNWYEDDQKAAIELFNKCRDRHLLIAGNVPNFWDLDGGILSRFRYYIFIPKRGIMWVFRQDNNPFAGDKWNVAENRKIFRKKGNPYSCPNFLAEIYYSDLDAGSKQAYYAIRNTKRRSTEGQNNPKLERYAGVKQQRDRLVRFIYKQFNVPMKDLAELTGLSESMISYIVNGVY